MARMGMAILAAAFFVHCGAHAENASMGPWRLGAGVGYTTVSLEDVRWNLEDLLKVKSGAFVDYLYSTGSYGSGIYELEYPKGAYSVEAGLIYMVTDRIGLGGQVEYLIIPEFNGNVTGWGAFGESIDYRATINTALVPVLFGIYAETEVTPGAIALGGRIMAGPVFASGDVSEQQLFMDPSWPAFALAATWNGDYPMSGHGIAYEICANAVYGITERTHMYVELAYRGANLKSMSIDRNVDMDGDGIFEIRRGDEFRDIAGGVLPWQFSGVKLSLGLRFII